MLRFHHLIIGAKDLAQSEVFYREVLGFRLVDAFLDSGTGREGLVMVCFDDSGIECAELLFVPFDEKRLPSPQHLAFEVSSSVFERALAAARRYQLQIRAFPALDNTQTGPHRWESRGQYFEHFYLLDPSGLNLEILRRLQTN